MKYPAVTKKRMFYETMEDVLPGLKVVIESSDGNTETILPLDSFVTGSINNIATTQPTEDAGEEVSE